MKRIIWLIKKLPYRFIVSLGILGVGALFLAIWALFKPTQGAPITAGQASPVYFNQEETVLCGNTLINYRTGEIVANQWLEGFGDQAPNISKVITSDRIAIISANNGMVGAFDLNGKAKELLKAEGKPIGPAAFDKDFSEVVFVRDGNLWHGNANWPTSSVDSLRKLSDTGYFRPDCFRGIWLWHGGDLLLSFMGKTLQVDLTSGSVEEVPVSLSHLHKGLSPQGNFAAIPVNGRDMGIVNLLNGETNQFSLGQRIRKFLWLTPEKVAIQIGNNQTAQYDHASGKIEGPQETKQWISDIVAPSPDGECFVVVTGAGLSILDLKAKKDVQLKLPFTAAQWISPAAMLCSCDSINTSERGLWLVQRSGDTERLSNQPIDPCRGGSSSTPLSSNEGALFLTGGNLWRYDRSSRELKQVTQSGGLRPPIQMLPN